METSAPAVGGIKSIAEDRLEGAAEIRDFIDPKMSLIEIRRRLRTGDYPYWKEGRLFVASRSALLAHWRERAEQSSQPKPQPSPQNKSTRRGYLGRAR
jgi:hypothetical protein